VYANPNSYQKTERLVSCAKVNQSFKKEEALWFILSDASICSKSLSVILGFSTHTTLSWMPETDACMHSTTI